MGWDVVGRAETVRRIRAALADGRAGPVILLGERGMGRSRVVAEAVFPDRRSADERPPDERPPDERHAVLVVTPGGRAPFSALAGLLPPGAGGSPASAAVLERLAAAVAERARGRRPVLVVDDAHLADAASMQVLRRLHRAHGAALVLTAAVDADPSAGPDPLDAVRFEATALTLRLQPLSPGDTARLVADALGGPVDPATAAALHTVVRGNPGRLRTLLEHLAADPSGPGPAAGGRLVRGAGGFRLDPALDPDLEPALDPDRLRPRPGAGVDAAELVAAVDAAWRELDVGRVEQLCLLAARCGHGERVATVWATVLLLRGRAGAGLAVLDRLADPGPEASVTRALLLAVGCHRMPAAEAVLVDAARADVASRERLLAARAWLLATTGEVERAAAALHTAGGNADRQATLFERAAHAVVARHRADPRAVVSHLRRALCTAEQVPGLPWFGPYLRAQLIDGLLLAGRLDEATRAAGAFHAGRPASGWHVAVALDALVGAGRAAAVEEPVPTPS